ncbi:MAG TPA: DUF2863 family protein, partial [Castellaniella sp.]|nr:DUF2863 family protein [Castellaniella sp.]
PGDHPQGDRFICRYVMASSPRSALSRSSRTLIALADALARSGSRVEDNYWEHLIGTQLDRALTGKPGRTIESALDQLMDTRSQAYEVLVEQAENRSEALRFTHQGAAWDALLFSAPILAWTRYKLPERASASARAIRVREERESAERGEEAMTYRQMKRSPWG